MVSPALARAGRALEGGMRRLPAGIAVRSEDAGDAGANSLAALTRVRVREHVDDA